MVIVSRMVRSLVTQGCRQHREMRLVCGNIPGPRVYSCPRCFRRLNVRGKGCVLNVYHFIPRGGLRRLVRTFGGLRTKSYGLILTNSASFRSRCSLKLGGVTRRTNIILAKFIGKRGLRSLLAGTHYCYLPSSRRKLPVTLLRTVDCRLPIIIDGVPTGLRMNLSSSYCFRYKSISTLTTQLRGIVSRSCRDIRCSVTPCS